MISAASRTALATLPPSVEFSGVPPWGVVSTATLADTLRVDRGLWGCWKLRRLTPPELSPSWLAGRASAYLSHDVLAWLADRNGLPLADRASAWRTYLNDVYGIEATSVEEARVYVAAMAKGAGPDAYEGVKFTREGFEAYIKMLLQ